MANNKKPAGSSNAKKASSTAKKGSASTRGPAAVRNAKKSTIVSKKQRPWGIIAAAIAVVVFAGAIVTYAVIQVKNKEAEAAANDPQKISGVKTFDYAASTGVHTAEDVKYAETPPVGGTHNPEWADCSGTVYKVQIKNENAVHSLEHGAVWVTYDPTLPAAEVAKLAKLVDGVDFMFMSPYKDEGGKISLQSWGHQLKLSSADDPRIKKYIDGFRVQQKYTPEFGASCSNPTFKTNPKVPGDSGSTGGGATDAPVSGAAKATASAGTTPSA